MPSSYLCFYLDGRREKIIRNDIDVDALAHTILADSDLPLRKAILAASENAAKPLETGKVRRVWIAENADEIKEAGGDENLAFRAWVRGRVDELAYSLEDEVVAALGAAVSGDDSDDDEEDEDEDEEEGEDEEDDDEDDED